MMRDYQMRLGAGRDPRSVVGLVSVLLVVLGFVAAAGVEGFVVGVGIGVVWYLTPAPVAFAIGHVLGLAVLPTSPSVLWLGSIEIGLLGILTESLRVFNDSSRGIATVAGVVGVGFVVVAWIRDSTGTLWLAALGFVGVYVVLAYGVHRYELVRLGLVEDSP